MSRVFTTLLLTAAPLLAHGGQFRPASGQPRVPTPPGLPAQPTAPAETGKVTHDWVVWWGYSQFQYVDYRRMQRERRAPVSGSEVKKDVDAWRDELRARLIPVLRDALRDKDKEVRTAAAVALGKLEATEAIDDLLRMLERDKLQEAREAALAGLMYLRDPKLRDTFVGLVKQKSEKIRIRGFALFGIGRLGDDEALKFLQGFFDRKNRRARAMLPTSSGELRQFQVACLAALVMSEADGLDDFFAQVAGDKRYDEQVRAYAVTALGKRKAAGKVPELTAMLRNRNEEEQIRRSAAVALGVVAKPADAEAVAALERAADVEKDDPLRHFSLVALGRIGGGDAVKFLLQYAKGAQNEDRGFALIALGLSKDARTGPVLVDALHTERNAKRKAAAAIAIALLGDGKLAAEVDKEYRQAKDWLLLQSC
jgi:HEAT repeat protein